MADDMLLPFALPAIRLKKLTAAFDGGRLSSDGGLLLLREAERGLGIADRLASAIRDRRDPTRINHTMPLKTPDVRHRLRLGLVNGLEHRLVIHQNIPPRSQGDEIQAGKALIAIFGYEREETLLALRRRESCVLGNAVMSPIIQTGIAAA